MSSIHLREFEYYEPTTAAEAAKLLDEYGEKAQIMAGGIDLIPRIRDGSIQADCVISIQNIPELKILEYDAGQGFTFGAMVTLHTLDTCQPLKEHYPIIQQAIHQITSVQSKYMGTAVGNLCVATPASDLAPALMAHDAEVVVQGTKGTRTEKVSDFYTGYHKTTLRRDEFVARVFVPQPMEGSGEAFLNRVRTHADIAKITVAVMVSVKDNICRQARIGLGAVAPKVVRATTAEAVLCGQVVSRELIQKAAETAVNDTSPITDFRSTREYRLDMTQVLVGRALEKAFDRARGVDHV